MRHINLCFASAAGAVLPAFARQSHAQEYQFTDLGTLGGFGSNALAINHHGVIAGYSSVQGDGAVHATRWDGTTATDFDTLGGGYSIASAINNAGQVAGESSVAGEVATHATLWNGSIPTDLGALSGKYGSASAINASGQVVGFSLIDDGSPHATLRTQSTILDLNSALDAATVHTGWKLQYATSIHDKGSIVGIASNNLLGISNHAFKLSNKNSFASKNKKMHGVQPERDNQINESKQRE